MSNEEINRKIAEACGIDVGRIGVHQYFCSTCGEVDANHSFTHQTFVKQFQVPDYCSDLNAMHEAEKTLQGSAIRDYEIFLIQLLKLPLEYTPYTGPTFPLIHATAHQRALAFLKTVAPKL